MFYLLAVTDDIALNEGAHEKNHEELHNHLRSREQGVAVTISPPSDGLERFLRFTGRLNKHRRNDITTVTRFTFSEKETRQEPRKGQFSLVKLEHKVGSTKPERTGLSTGREIDLSTARLDPYSQSLRYG